jgi:transcriptional regulator with XRE-family HTH domain
MTTRERDPESETAPDGVPALDGDEMSPGAPERRTSGLPEGPEAASLAAAEDDGDQLMVAAAIGARLKEERRRLGVTLEDAAEAAGLSAAMLSRIENGKAAPSLRALTRLSRALTIPMPEFFEGLEDESEATLIKAGEGIKVNDPGRARGHRYEILARPSRRRALVEPWLVTIPDADESFPLYQAEGTGFIFMLEGLMRFRCGRQLFEVAPGDAILYDLATPHRQEPLEAPIRFLHVTLAAAPTRHSSSSRSGRSRPPKQGA